MFWPRDLAIPYPFGIAGSIAFWQIALYALLLVGVSLLVLRYWRTRKYLSFGWFWFVGTLLPVIGLVTFAVASYADRYTYISYIGLFIMIAWGLPELLLKWPQRKPALGISAAIALAAMGICAHRQVTYWSNSVTLFSHSLEVTQNNDLAYYNRGVAYNKLGRLQEAMKDFNTSIGINPDYADAYNNRGIAYDDLGRDADAIEDFRQAIRLKPDCAGAYTNLGIIYSRLGRNQDAIDAHREAIKIDPDYAEAYTNLGIAYSRLGRWQDAIDAHRQAIKIRPDLVTAYNNLALLIATNPEIKDRDASEAISLAIRACKLTDYKEPAFLGTLAAAYASAGRFSEAIDTANKALYLADATNQPQIKNIIRYHLSFYTQGKPYIEPPSKPLPDSGKP
jgi:tetratricopeptide (TPR) repeat protein